MTIRIILIICLFSINQMLVNAQETKSVFKSPKLKFQWDAGKTIFRYSRNGLPKQYIMQGSSIDFIGVVIKNNLNLALGIDYVAATPQNFDQHTDTSTVYRMINYGNFFFKFEPLLRPSKIINFSFPMRIGYGGATYEFVKHAENRSYVGTFSDEFILFSPGMNILVNLFNNLSLGVGVSHRFLKPVDTRNNASQNHPSIQFFLRFKLGGNQS